MLGVDHQQVHGVGADVEHSQPHVATLTSGRLLRAPGSLATEIDGLTGVLRSLRGVRPIDVARARLVAQCLVGPPLRDPATVVAHLGAVQAQELPEAFWNVALRCGHPALDDVQADLDAGRILRVHALRPTWHFVAPADIRWIQALTAPRVRALAATYDRRYGLDAGTVSRSHRAVVAALRGGNQLTRAELREVVRRSGFEPTAWQLAQLLMHAELAGLVVNGAAQGKRQTYALLDERVSGGLDLRGDDALAELTRRYFTGHGPATVKDLTWWATLTVAQVRRGIDLLGEELASESIDGIVYYRSAAPAPGPARRSAARAYVLGAYDEAWVAFTQSRAVFNVAGTTIAAPGLEADYAVSLLMLGSQIVGHWRRRAQTTNSLEVDAVLGVDLDDAGRAAFEAAFGRYAEHLGRAVEVTWRRIASG